MGEIADALRRADPLDAPPENPKKRQESDVDRQNLARNIPSEPVLDSRPRVETQQPAKNNQNSEAKDQDVGRGEYPVGPA